MMRTKSYSKNAAKAIVWENSKLDRKEKRKRRCSGIASRRIDPFLVSRSTIMSITASSPSKALAVSVASGVEGTS